MTVRQRKDRRAFRCDYRRRTIVEGVFGAVKRRFEEVVPARYRNRRWVETLRRVVTWSTMELEYDQRQGS